uniref:Uncharacterized protein n=1 Tax=viral metagenome TaxID=1070528 RepID=A0A6M3JJE9_9ZZZZ
MVDPQHLTGPELAEYEARRERDESQSQAMLDGCDHDELRRTRYLWQAREIRDD